MHSSAGFPTEFLFFCKLLACFSSVRSSLKSVSGLKLFYLIASRRKIQIKYSRSLEERENFCLICLVCIGISQC